MKLSTFLAGTFSVLAAATPLVPRCTDVSVTYTINDFTLRKYDGQNINTAFFNITSLDGSLNFECDAYDPTVGAVTDNFQIGKIYLCGPNFFSWSYVPDELFLSQKVSDTLTLSGSEDVGNGFFCRAGGSTPNDLVCSLAPFNITLSGAQP